MAGRRSDVGEAELLSEVRRTVSAAVGIPAKYLTPADVRRRYAALMHARGTPVTAQTGSSYVQADILARLAA
jgi:hypothetical protein